MRTWLCAALALAGLSPLQAETGRDAWLRYRPLQGAALDGYRAALPAVVTAVGQSAVIGSARNELVRGVRGMLGRTLREESAVPPESAIVLGTQTALAAALPGWRADSGLIAGGYRLKTFAVGAARYIVVAGADDRGVLYGAFALLRKIALGEAIHDLDERQTPYAPVRWVDEWDNLDGSIERGYAGRSIFWEDGHVRADLTRVTEYGRLLASLGINGCAMNNVNADLRLLTPEFMPQIARIAAALQPWGVRVAIAVDFGSPQKAGGLDTFDPLDERVAAWWKAKTDQLYRAIPDLAGFVMKADSEGRAGPSAYGRTQAEAANVVARALAPHRGLLFYRAFVYDHHMDWRDPKNDRARAAYDIFAKLDGKFEPNVIIQIKNGPIDFQVREPVSPLFGALEKTNESIELQITQEYMGQARHLVYLVPMWQETLAEGKIFHRPAGGFVGVSNVGLDENWTGNHFSQANLYGFGRLAWDPGLSAGRITDEWTRLTFGSDPDVVKTITAMQLGSLRTYENYTGPLGLQTLTDITGNHYGVNVEASERNSWGQWHKADAEGVGMDRTVATGTGYIGQYSPAVAQVYESLETCPDDLLLFMHHVPYTYALHSGKSVIQYIYDAHYEGAAAVAQYVRDWEMLEGHIDEQRYNEVLSQLTYQRGQAELWRDAVTRWFWRASGVADASHRVGSYPGRVEAESMRLEGYEVTPVTPWEAASGGKAVTCGRPPCAATYKYEGENGWRTIRVRYFDTNNGAAHFSLRVAGQLVDQWEANDRFPTQKLDGSSSTERSIPGIALRKGDEITIEGSPDGGDHAALDYIETGPNSE